MKRNESSEQQALIVWCELNRNKYRGLDLLFAIPNGGSRHKLEAFRLKKEGVKAGVPDLFLPVSKKGYNGLFIEMKYGRNKLTEKQKEWIINLNLQGYKTAVCYGMEEAITVLKEYYS